MQKTFDIIIDDQQPVNPNNSFAIYRGDNVAFNFTFQRGGVALDVEGATLRVFAKKIQKNGQVDKLSNPLFAEDFIATNTATFNSSQTCGDAGNYILSVLLMSSDDAVITSQCIYFELKENGYAGYYQPSEDFRDAIFDASQNVIDAEANAKQYSESAKISEQNTKASEQSAKTSEANASTFRDDALSFSDRAETFSRNAEQSANDCAESVAIVQSAEGECLEAVANAEYYARQSQEASERAIAITDPEGFRTSTTESIASLSEAVVEKSNRGEFWFNGGSLACANTWTNSSFSLALTFSMTSEDFDINSSITTSDYQWIGTAVSASTSDANSGFYVRYRVYNGVSQAVLTYNGLVQSIVYLSGFKEKYCDGNKHTMIVICTEDILKLQVDDEIITGTNGGFRGVSDRTPFKIFKNNSKLSRIKYFNFDMSRDDAPYTIDDYIAGKDESPLLQTTQPVIDWHNLKSHTQSTTQTKGQSGTFELNRAEATSPRIFENGTFKVGYTYYVKLSGKVLFPTGQRGSGLFLGLPTKTAEITNNLTGEVVISTPSNSKYLFGVGNGVEFDRTIKFIPTETSTDNNCFFDFNQIETNSNSYVNVSVRCDSVLLSLEDYSFNGRVLDVSGNNNTATITGVVKGTYDNAVEQMYQAFSSRIGNLTE